MSSRDVLSPADLARIERCRRGMIRALPQTKRAAKVLREGRERGESSPVDEQVECMETCIWLCGIVKALALPIDDAAGETQSLRLVTNSVMELLGQSQWIAEYLVRYGKGEDLNRGGARSVGELFLIELAKMTKAIGLDGPASPPPREPSTS